MDFFSRIILLCGTVAILAFSCNACSAKEKPNTKNAAIAKTDSSVEPAGPKEEDLTLGVSSSAVAQAIAAGSETMLQPTFSPDADADFCLGETVFIGDSRTYGLLTYNILPPEQVYAVNGATQKSIQERKFIQLDDSGTKLTVDEAVAIRKPQQIVVAFGINAIPLMQESEFLSEYDILVDSLVAASPESKIIIQSILPVSWWKFQEIADFNNQLIDYYNDLLYDYAEKNGYSYLNLADEFKADDNSLNPKYDAGDGLHFTTSTYDMLLEFYKKYLIF